MDIFIQKRHFLFLGCIIIGLLLIIKNYQMAGNIMRAGDLREQQGRYHSGDYVTVEFDSVLYMEYEGLYGGKQKRYDVYGTPDSSVYYVNGLDEKYVLLEITNEKLIEKMDNGQMDRQKILGTVSFCNFDVDEFLTHTDGKANIDKTIVVRQVEQPDLVVTKMWTGCGMIILGIVLFCIHGGMASLVRQRMIQTEIEK